MRYLQKKKFAIMGMIDKIKGFVRAIAGVPPLTLTNCVDKDSLINYTISGNSVQNGNPRPDNLVKIESVGEYDEETGKYKIPVKASDGNSKSIITYMYLNEPLRKINGYADSIDFENQKVIRKVWSEHITSVYNKSSTVRTYTVFLSEISKKPSGVTGEGSSDIMSERFGTRGGITYGSLGQIPNCIMSYITTGRLNRVTYTFGDSAVTTVEQAQELIGDGFEVIYVLAEPIEETIDLSKLPTFKGTTVYSIETTVQPSNMSATYYSTSKGD